MIWWLLFAAWCVWALYEFDQLIRLEQRCREDRQRYHRQERTTTP
jgi:hypothetical protein